MTNFLNKNISGWGKYPVEECSIFRPESYKEINEILQSQSRNSYLAYGLGRSYGDTPLNKNNGLIVTKSINKFISFDNNFGILECDCGVTFEEIIDTFLPRGFFLPVTPGTKYVTLGGAIANDVHGKNHHLNGSISEYIIDFNLLLASGEVINCSRNSNSDIFWATVGGIGLTGIILNAKVKLIPVETAYYEVHYQKAGNLDKAIQLFEESDHKYQYSVAWIDCLARGNSLGKCVLMRGNHAQVNQLSNKKNLPLSIKQKLKLNVPFNLPSFTLNQLSINLFNTLYYAKSPIESVKIVDYDSFFYPLDSIYNWNRLYGKKGFVQYQAVFPSESSYNGLVEMLQKLSNGRKSSFLAVLKSSGQENNGLLSFPKKGYTLALDIPMSQDLIPFLNHLDEIVIKHGGRVYLAKDSVLKPEIFEIMYPRIKQFKEIKKLIDPNNMFSSSMARRLKIVE